MKIKKIQDLTEYEGEFIITDGRFDIEGTCVSLPLSNNRAPYIGESVTSLHAFFLTDEPIIIKLKDIRKQKTRLKKKCIIGMSYYVQGCVIDEKKYLVKVYDFIINLEYLFGSEYENKTFNYKKGEWLSFLVDRFDITIL